MTSRSSKAPSGVLVVDKPGGLTSAQVVSRVKRALKARRVGHTGTLDPLATGVLPLCLGEATKLAGYLLADDKAYEAELCFGVETDTLDAEGSVTARRPAAAAAMREEALLREMAALVGELDQVPPMYSALKQGGKRLHELARAGRSVPRPPRRVEVYALDLLEFEPPRATLRIDCSKGTYVRALARDLGAALGCGAHVSSLRRLRAGPFDIAQALPLEDIDPELASRALIAPAEAVSHLPGVRVPSERLREVANGRVLPWPAIGEGGAPEGRFRLLAPEGELIAIASVRDGAVAYERVLSSAAEAHRGP